MKPWGDAGVAMAIVVIEESLYIHRKKGEK